MSKFELLVFFFILVWNGQALLALQKSSYSPKIIIIEIKIILKSSKYIST